MSAPWLLLAAIAGGLLLIGGTAAAIETQLTPDDGSDGKAPTLDNSSATTQTIAGLLVTLVDGAALWQTDLAVDADGAPDAYGPPGNSGLDALANAGRPGNWSSLATDDGTPQGTPLLNDAGYYVSTTSLVDDSFGRGEQRRYVDASRVAYLAIGKDILSELGADLGDLAYLVNRSSGQGVSAIIADHAPRGHMHEASVAAAAALGLNSSPRNGGGSGIAFVIFPGTSSGWPRPSYADDAQAKFDGWGGGDRVAALIDGGP